MLLQRLKDDLKIAMRDKNVISKEVLQGIIGAYTLKMKEEKLESLTEAQEIDVLKKELKMYKESLEGAAKADRQDLIGDYQTRMAIVQAYIPKQLSSEEVKSIILETVEELGLDLNMGTLMKTFRPMFAGKADMGIVNEVVRELINRG